MYQPDANADDPSRGRRPATNPFPDSFAPDRRVIEGSSTELADEPGTFSIAGFAPGGQFGVDNSGQFGVSRLCRLAAPGMMKMELGFGSLWLEAGVNAPTRRQR